MLTVTSKGEMFKAIAQNLTKIELKYQDGTTSAIQNESQFWNEPDGTDTLTQKTDVVFDITSVGDKNVSGFNMYFESDTTNTTPALTHDFETIYNYPNDGTFTFDGARIILN
jgi:hypothetical protein